MPLSQTQRNFLLAEMLTWVIASVLSNPCKKIYSLSSILYMIMLWPATYTNILSSSTRNKLSYTALFIPKKCLYNQITHSTVTVIDAFVWQKERIRHFKFNMSEVSVFFALGLNSFTRMDLIGSNVCRVSDWGKSEVLWALYHDGIESAIWSNYLPLSHGDSGHAKCIECHFYFETLRLWGGLFMKLLSTNQFSIYL